MNRDGNYIITLYFCTVLSLFGVLFLHGCAGYTVTNDHIKMPSDNGQTVVESDFSESTIFKNLCEIGEICLDLVFENTTLDTLNSAILEQNEEYDFMWKNAVSVTNDSVILYPLLNTDELSLFWSEYGDISIFKTYIIDYIYSNDSNSDSYSIDDVLNHTGNCSISSILLGYWVNHYCYENGLNRNTNGSYISVFETDETTTISVMFVKYLSPERVGHIYPIAYIRTSDTINQYILDIANDRSIIIKFLDHLESVSET